MHYVKFSISWVTVLILTRPRKNDKKKKKERDGKIKGIE
jgi:hypothetical protein